MNISVKNNYFNIVLNNEKFNLNLNEEPYRTSIIKIFNDSNSMTFDFEINGDCEVDLSFLETNPMSKIWTNIAYLVRTEFKLKDNANLKIKSSNFNDELDFFIKEFAIISLNNNKESKLSLDIDKNFPLSKILSLYIDGNVNLDFSNFNLSNDDIEKIIKQRREYFKNKKAIHLDPNLHTDIVNVNANYKTLIKNKDKIDYFGKFINSIVPFSDDISSLSHNIVFDSFSSASKNDINQIVNSIMENNVKNISKLKINFNNQDFKNYDFILNSKSNINPIPSIDLYVKNNKKPIDNFVINGEKLYDFSFLFENVEFKNNANIIFKNIYNLIINNKFLKNIKSQNKINLIIENIKNKGMEIDLFQSCDEEELNYFMQYINSIKISGEYEYFTIPFEFIINNKYLDKINFDNFKITDKIRIIVSNNGKYNKNTIYKTLLMLSDNNKCIFQNMFENFILKMKFNNNDLIEFILKGKFSDMKAINRFFATFIKIIKNNPKNVKNILNFFSLKSQIINISEN